MVPWEGYVSDETMGTFAPIALYWVYAGGYQLVLHRRPLERYRLHTRAEEEEKNLVALPAVVRGVLLQQLVQAIVAMILFMGWIPISHRRRSGLASSTTKTASCSCCKIS
ncbi:hypothetical protein EE612_040800 [Oryza sativa]|nr:hypothetical protein EE612_040800 [Oryza sativa]